MRPRCGAAPAVGAAQLARGCVAKTSRTVSLNCRTLPKPAAKRDVGDGRSVVSIRTRAVCARCARASASGPAPSSACSARSTWRRE
jgi:hypothetical protein